MAAISISDVFRPVEVDLWGHLFKTVKVTKTVAAGLKTQYDVISEAGDDEGKIVEAIGRLLDLRFEQADQKRKAPSVLVSERYEAGDLSVEDELLPFMWSVFGGDDRPT